MALAANRVVSFTAMIVCCYNATATMPLTPMYTENVQVYTFIQDEDTWQERTATVYAIPDAKPIVCFDTAKNVQCFWRLKDGTILLLPTTVKESQA